MGSVQDSTQRSSDVDDGEVRHEGTFAFVDLAGFTALTEAHGDAEAVAIVRAFRERAREVLGPGDEFVKSIGDAAMLLFPTPRRAIDGLRELLARELVIEDTVLLPRAGAHHGAAVADDGDYYGAAVNLAARVANEARGGQLLVTTDIALAATDAGLMTTHVGAVELRNVSESTLPVAVRDRPSDLPRTTTPVDPLARHLAVTRFPDDRRDQCLNSGTRPRPSPTFMWSESGPIVAVEGEPTNKPQRHREPLAFYLRP
jgi:adenylate cyclase